MIQDRREFLKLVVPYFYVLAGQNTVYITRVSDIDWRYHNGKRIELELRVADVGSVTRVKGEDQEVWFVAYPFFFRRYISGGDEYILRIKLTDKKIKDTEKLEPKDYLIGQIRGKDRDVLGMLFSYAKRLKNEGKRMYVEGIYNKPILNMEFVYTDPRTHKSGGINTSSSLEEVIRDLGGWSKLEGDYIWKKILEPCLHEGMDEIHFKD